MKLAKAPPNINNAISNQTGSWYTILNLQGKNESLMSETIKSLRGIFQGESFSVLLFVLALNLLSFMFRKKTGYPLGKMQNCEAYP